ncbi:MAG: hypothetical protein MHPSP_004431, partial [Paramarteilia canceri]
VDIAIFSNHKFEFLLLSLNKKYGINADLLKKKKLFILRNLKSIFSHSNIVYAETFQYSCISSRLDQQISEDLKEERDKMINQRQSIQECLLKHLKKINFNLNSQSVGVEIKSKIIQINKITLNSSCGFSS